jgi:hypothetical protein
MSGRIQVAPKAERTLDGITFASKAEMLRYAELQMLQRAGIIEGLERQPRYILQAKAHKMRSIVYVADFRYLERSSGHAVVEDVKGHRTDIYKLKLKLFRERYPDVDFREITA